MPTKRLSFHIGIGAYDHNVYQATTLISAPDDARAMYNLAATLDYTALDGLDRGPWDGNAATKPPNVLINNDASYAAVIDLFDESVAALNADGGRCLITFSGHGTRFDKDPPVPLGEGTTVGAACLFDFPLHDDVLSGLLGKFNKGIDVFLVLDCCQSGGTSSKLGNILNNQIVALDLIGNPRLNFGGSKAAPKPVVPPPPLPTKLLAQFKGFKRAQIAANVAAFEACRDTESTFDGKNPGDLSVYTRKFVDAVGDGTRTVREVKTAIELATPHIADCNPQFQPTADETFLDMPMKY